MREKLISPFLCIKKVHLNLHMSTEKSHRSDKIRQNHQWILFYNFLIKIWKLSACYFSTFENSTSHWQNVEWHATAIAIIHSMETNSFCLHHVCDVKSKCQDSKIFLPFFKLKYTRTENKSREFFALTSTMVKKRINRLQ